MGAAYSLQLSLGNLSCSDLPADIHCPEAFRDLLRLSGSFRGHKETGSEEQYSESSKIHALCKIPDSANVKMVFMPEPATEQLPPICVTSCSGPLTSGQRGNFDQ